MIIEKHGDPNKIDMIHRILKFECIDCGCVFKADTTEYEIHNVDPLDYDRPYTTCTCPECGRTVWRYA